MKDDTIWNKNFICVMLGNFMMSMAFGSTNPLVVTYTEHIGAGIQMAGLLTGMFFGVSFVFRPFVGPAMTKLDKRKLLVIVFIIGAAANVGYALFQSISAFVAFRFLNGVQFSFIGTLLMAMAGDHLPKAKLTSGMGMYGVGAAAGSAIAPSIGEALLRFGTNLRDESFGFSVMFMFGAFIFAMAIIPTLLIDSDKKSAEDLISTGAWHKNIYTRHAIPVTILMFFTMLPHAMIHVYMVEFGWELGIASVGAFYVVLAVTLTVTRPIGGYLIDRFGIAPIMFPALALFALALFVIGSSSTLNTMILGAVLAAIGLGASQPTLQAMCMQIETPLRRSVATNTLFVAIDLGMFLGPVFGGFVRVRADFATMYRLSAILPILALITFAIILPIHKRRVAELEKRQEHGV